MRRVTAADLAVWRDLHQAHYLYRCYDAEGLLIYIGCTNDAKARMVTHRSSKTVRASLLLQRFMDRHEVDGDVYAGRIAGRRAEAAAIASEQPLFNVAQRRYPSFITTNKIGRYLIARGEIELACRFACTCWRETQDAGKCDSWCAPHVAEGVLQVLPAGEAA